MGKIVKYCNVCDESFAEKFGFCPICGETLKKFEMNPIAESTKNVEEVSADVVSFNLDKLQPDTSGILTAETSSRAEEPEIVKTDAFSDNKFETSAEEPNFDLADDGVEIIEDVPVSKSKFVVAGASSGFDGDASHKTYETKADYGKFQTSESNNYRKDDGFSVTVLTEKNVKQRNLILLGALVLMLTLSVGGLIASIFNHSYLVGAIGDELSVVVPVIDETPMAVEKPEQPKKKEDEGGGGGGGGGDEETPTSKGQLAPQTREPILISPSKTMVKKDFELKQQAFTEGDKKTVQTDEPYGDPTSKYTALSDGRGSGGGQGSGTGTGQGSGRGTGQGSGIGSGSGSGTGTGNGGGTGPGSGSPPAEPKPKPTGPTKGINFLSKPTPKYTDEARQNNVQGSVTLKIQFLSSGQIGSISPINRLPYGLTEQAIAAARQIRFEPALRDGQPVTTTKSVQFSFTIY